MAEALRVILLVALAAAALTTAALILAWWMEPVRRMRRALLKSLGSAPEAEALSPAEGRAAGHDFDAAQVAEQRNTRTSLDILAPEAEQVVLRLMFADARHPEFELALWDAALPVQTSSPGEALRLGRRWLSHLEALLKG